ncbi:MAG TPA: class I SAM-dependent methyltransferase [Dietzia timorensis]|uniref:Class I SAM-dependent methyltransferase n=1 Tax=Dietzia timorensis TaxID=499555 RepID=A0A921F192_9ACTN|nr:class I SAM-dependent methyltransferase [Dietzia timorensis]HJE89836.1 class I SAM-dependent methyltransferase [Dietzia timorensis]
MSKVESAFCRSTLWRPIASATARFAGRTPLSRRVLELGCGGGDIARSLTKSKPGITYVASDADPKMVELAQRRLADREDITVTHEDATELSFPDESFDTVVSFLMLHHIVQWEAAITEVARVLRRGGRFVGYDLTRTGANSAMHKFDGSQYLLITPSELAESFRAHGLDAKVRSFGFGQAMSFSATKPR